MRAIVIVGSGMAGYTLAREYRKLNPEYPLLMVCNDDAINYAKPTLSNAYAGNKTAEQIALGDATKMATQLNMQILQQHDVQQIDAAAQQLHCLNANGEAVQIDYSQLILAVGANPIRLAIAGDASQDILAVNTLQDYQVFRAQIDSREDKRVVIMGAGLIGCEFANDLLHSGHDVTVIDLAPQPLGRLLPSHVAQQFQQKLQQSGVKFELATTVEKVQKSAQGQHYVVSLSNGKTLEADVVLSAIGLQPNVALAKNSQLDVARGIVTNTLLQTNVANIYAMGDCAEVNGLLLPYVMPIMQQARALAKTLNQSNTHVHYPAMPVAVKTPAAPLTVLPVPVDVTATWETETLEDGLIAKAIDAEGTLRGFVLLGATAGKQRLALAKLVPDLIPAQV